MTLKSKRIKIGKYASRSSKSSTGDMLSAPISGMFYDTGDNYDLSSSIGSFRTEQVWKSKDMKNKYGRFKLKKE